MKKVRKNRKVQDPGILSNRTYIQSIWARIFLLVLIFLLPYLFWNRYHLQPIRLATQSELAAAKKTVHDQFLTGSTDCFAGDNKSPVERKTTYEKYLRVNKYANRAVIRQCNDTDALIAKLKDGTWAITYVNINLDRRANPSWQKACLIGDITVADTVVRPENRSIDAGNLQACNYLRHHGELEPLQGGND